jgi:CRP/FNR family transcriptional regulator
MRDLRQRFDTSPYVRATDFAWMESLGAVQRVAPKHADLVRQHSEGPEIFALMSGWAFRYKISPRGGRQILNLVLPGEFFGLDALHFAEHEQSVQAITDVSYIIFKLDILNEPQAVRSNLSSRLVQAAALERRLLEHQLMRIGRCSALSNVAGFLLELRDRLDQRGRVSDNMFELPMTQDEIADATGLTTVHVNRVLRLLRESELVIVAHRRVHITNLPALRDLVERAQGKTLALKIA